MCTRCLAVALSLMLAAGVSPIFGANFSVRSQAPCTVSLDGRINDGDADTLARIVSQHSLYGAILLCLNSEGGHLLTALEIADYIYEQQWATYVGEGDRCDSACALIFMMGHRYITDEVSVPARVLHIGGRLSFHRPNIEKLAKLPYFGYEHVATSYESALNAVQRLVQLSLRANLGWRNPIVPVELLAQVFRHTGQEAFVIDTVEKAGRYAIGLDGYRPPPGLTKSSAIRACRNLSRWADQRLYSDSEMKWVDVDYRYTVEQAMAPMNVYWVKGTRNPNLVRDCVFFTIDERIPEHDHLDVGLYGCVRDWGTGVALGIETCNLDSITEILGSDYPSFGDLTGYNERRFPDISLFDPKSKIAELERIEANYPRVSSFWVVHTLSPLQKICSDKGQGRISSVEEYAYARAAPGRNAKIRWKVQLSSRVEFTETAFTGTPDLRGSCRVLCDKINSEVGPGYWDYRDGVSKSITAAARTFQTKCVDKDVVWKKVSGKGLSIDGEVEHFDGYISGRLIDPR